MDTPITGDFARRARLHAPQRSWRLCPYAAVAALLCVIGPGAASALARQFTSPDAGPGGEQLTPPTPILPHSTPILWWIYMVAILLIAMVVGANVIPSKRGHQD